jgi:catechol 2,3-dioxygenase-like lactoylglutathione lyase family enzyme
MNKLDHVGIATNDIDKYVEIFSAMGGKVVCSAEAKEFEALCVFIEFENSTIELIKPTVKGNHIDRFIEKFGDGRLHHIAFEDDTIEGVCGAKLGMFVEFNKPNSDCGILIEKVRYE